MTTDSKGRFVFSRLAPGQYTVAAQRLGYFDGLLGESAPMLDVIGLRQGRRFSLAAGQWINDAVIRLWRPGSISGRVLDERGEPVVGRYVRALTTEPTGIGSPFRLAGADVTDDQGRFSIGRLLGTRHVVAVLPIDPDGVLGSVEAGVVYPLQFYPAAPRSTMAASIPVQFGQDVEGIEIVLQPRIARRVAGRVDGPPESFARMRLVLTPAGEPLVGTTTQVARASVAPDGSFVFLSVAVGEYTIAVAPDSVMLDSRPATQFAGGPSAWSLPGNRRSEGGPGPRLIYWTETPLNVGDADVTDLVVPLRRAGSISGRIVVDAGTVRLPRNLMARRLGAPAGFAPLTEVAQDGRFTIDGLFGGEYYLSVAGPVVSMIANGRDYTYEPIDLKDGAHIADLVITVTAGAVIVGAIDTPPGFAGEPLSVMYFPQDRRRWSHAGLQSAFFGHVPVRPDGFYETRPTLPPGSYYAVAVSDGWRDSWQSAEFLEAAALVATRVEVGRDERKRVNLQRQRIRGR